MLGLWPLTDANRSSVEWRHRVVGERLWPVVRGMALTILEDKLDYAIEGAQLQPEHGKELRALHVGSVRACFVGYASVVPQQKLRHIREDVGLPNDWLQEHTHEQILRFIDRMAAYSTELRDACDRHGLSYVDMSRDFEDAIDRAFRYLTAAG